MSMDNKIDISVSDLIKYGEELESAVHGFIRIMEQEKEKNNISVEESERLEDACIQLQNLIDSMRKAAIDYVELEKNIMDAIMFI